MGAAGYAGKATVLATQRADGLSEADQITCIADLQVALMSEEACRAIAALPLLGENRGGPLAPGRLATGHIGATIRAVQAHDLVAKYRLHA